MQCWDQLLANQARTNGAIKKDPRQTLVNVMCVPVWGSWHLVNDFWSTLPHCFYFHFLLPFTVHQYPNGETEVALRGMGF